MNLIWSVLIALSAHALPTAEHYGASICIPLSGTVIRADIDRALSPSDFSGLEAQIDAAIEDARAAASSGDLCKSESALKTLSISINQKLQSAGRIDSAYFKQADYWQTTHEALKIKIDLGRYGDCEDFAILKYWVLRRAGCSPDQMYIGVLSGLGRQQDHAVLLVNGTSSTIVLDNVPAQNGRPYLQTPYFSEMNLVYLINEEKVKYLCPKDSQFRVLK